MNLYQNMMQNLPWQPPAQRIVIDVQNEEEMYNYPVAPGNSVYFGNVNEPMIYIKTMASQYGMPMVEKFKRVEETKPVTEYALKTDVDELRAMIEKLTEAKDE